MLQSFAGEVLALLELVMASRPPKTSLQTVARVRAVASNTHDVPILSGSAGVTEMKRPMQKFVWCGVTTTPLLAVCARAKGR